MRDFNIFQNIDLIISHRLNQSRHQAEGRRCKKVFMVQNLWSAYFFCKTCETVALLQLLWCIQLTNHSMTNIISH